MVKLAEHDDFDALLSDLWKESARLTLKDEALPRKLRLDRGDFHVFTESLTAGWTGIVIVTPSVEGPVEAAIVVIAFDDQFEFEPLFFTCEAPSVDGMPFMIGQWRKDDARSNLGPIADVSMDAMCDFVASYIDNTAASRTIQRDEPRGNILREIPDIDDYLSNGSPTNQHASSGAPLRGRQRIGKEGGGSEAPSPSPISRGKVPSSMSFRCKWSSPPQEIARESVANLYLLRDMGGSALVMKTSKAKGLGRRVSSYVQFMWSDDGLLVEIQGDYSYWGLSVASSMWPLFEEVGLKIPTSSSMNFQRILRADSSSDDQIAELTDIFSVFASVMQPTGRIDSSSF